MGISGLVITLTQRDEAAGAALAKLRGDPRLTMGERNGPRQAAVGVTPSVEQDEHLVADLRATEGVVDVEIVFVGLDETTEHHTSPRATGTGGVGC